MSFYLEVAEDGSGASFEFGAVLYFLLVSFLFEEKRNEDPEDEKISMRATRCGRMEMTLGIF